MGKNKLAKFEQMLHIPLVFQYPFAVLQREGGFAMRGKWGRQFFGNDNPITVELGCGKGEYTVGLAKRFPDRNFIGIDIKGARMYTGATEAQRCGMKNVAFLRTSIELLDAFFAPGEVDQVWITFADPQMKKQRKRLTSTRFLSLYRAVGHSGMRINVKTDSPFLYTYTRRLCLANPQAIAMLCDTDNLYAAQDTAGTPLDIRTHYEQQWLARGKTIKYLAFTLDSDTPLADVADDDIPCDDYRSYGRDAATAAVLAANAKTTQA